MMNRTFRIGDFIFRIDCPESVQPPENFLLFAIPEEDVPDSERIYHYQIEISDHFPETDGTCVARREDLLVYVSENDLETRYIGIRGRKEPYACYRETGQRDAAILISPDIVPDMRIDTIFSSLFCLEKRMLERDALVLHCAYIVRKRVDGTDEAVLFSAPSETGKSTQADLWQKYRGTCTVNGDRGLLRRDLAGRWIADGWPVCGSSGICHRMAAPIRAIVLLSQEKRNAAERLIPMRAFIGLYSQVTINRWNRAENEKAMNLLDALIGSVPVYHLGCDISEDAVDCLESALESEYQNFPNRVY